MKTKLSILSLFVLSMLFISCDSNKSKVSDVAKKFVQAAINDDKATIYELYPEIRDYPKLQITKDLTGKGITVEFNETDSVYIAYLDEQTKLILEVSDSNTVKIIDSYNIFFLDSISNELAVKTGVPINQLSDLENACLFFTRDNTSLPRLASYMIEKSGYFSAMDGNLYDHDAKIIWGSGDVRIEIPVSNKGRAFVKGEDYSVEISYYKKNTEERVSTSVEPGVDLAPGETFVFISNPRGLYRYADNNNLIYHIDFHFKQSWAELLVKYYSNFSGNEYKEYKKWWKKIDEELDKLKPGEVLFGKEIQL